MMWSPVGVLMALLAYSVTTTAFQAVPLSQSTKFLGRHSFPWCRASHFKSQPLFLSENDETDDEEEAPPFFKGDSLVLDTSRALKRTSWLSWWAQVILTTVSSVTLLFARNVVKASTQNSTNGFFLAGSGIATSFISIFWTWGGARLANRLVKKESTTRIKAANMLRRAVRVAVYLNVIGIFLTVLGAEQIVGGLAIKVLTMQGVIGTAPGSAAVATQTLQPLDILVVQANTNTLLSHFCGLVLALYLTNFIDKLDPPSHEDDKRKQK